MKSISSESDSSQAFSRPLSEFEPREIEWLVQDYIPIGCCTLLNGDGGIGKSYAVAAIAAAVSAGRVLFGGSKLKPGNVLVLAAEDDPSVVLRPRFDAHEADISRVRIHSDGALMNSEGMNLLDAEIERYQVRLAVIDPIVAFLGVGVDANKATDVREIMKRLHEMAQKHQCAILIVRHWNKAPFAQASQRGSGSVDWRNAARASLSVIKSGDERFLASDKNNYGVSPKTVPFKIEGKRVVWGEPVETSADELLSAQTESQDDRSVRAEAREFLEDILKSGPVAQRQVEGDARGRGISFRTVERAKKDLGVKAVRMDSQWFWQLSESEDRQTSQSIGGGGLKHVGGLVSDGQLDLEAV